MKRHKSSRGGNSARQSRPALSAAVWIRLSCITILWLLICWLLIATRPFSPWLIFIIVSSGIVVFVPLYKKYVRNAKD